MVSTQQRPSATSEEKAENQSVALRCPGQCVLWDPGYSRGETEAETCKGLRTMCAAVEDISTCPERTLRLA